MLLVDWYHVPCPRTLLPSLHSALFCWWQVLGQSETNLLNELIARCRQPSVQANSPLLAEHEDRLLHLIFTLSAMNGMVRAPSASLLQTC